MDRLKLAIFDCDGTLVDSQHTIIECFQTAFEKVGLAKPEDDAIRRNVGLSMIDFVARLMPDADEARWRQVIEAYREAFTAKRQQPGYQEPLFPGVSDVLHRLEEAGYLFGVATGKSLAGLKRTLDMHGLRDHFSTLQTADLNPGKPNPGMIEAAIAETGVEVADTVMIGDTSYDIEMARNAGTLAIGVAWGYHQSQELLDAGAYAVIETFEELPTLLAYHLGGSS